MIGTNDDRVKMILGTNDREGKMLVKNDRENDR